MFGFRSSVPSSTHQSLLAAENALAVQSLGHPDGWGIGWFVDDDAYVIKSANAAHACDRFRRASERLKSHTFIVHVRRATVGKKGDHLNAHPFRFGRWIFAHNGTLFHFDRLQRWLLEHTDPSLQPLILGDTDSEHLFFFVLSRLQQAGVDRTGRRPSDARLVAKVVRQAGMDLDAWALREGADRPIANMLLTDGRLFVAHRAGMPLHMSTQKRFCPEFHTCPAEKVCMLPSRPEDKPVNHLLLASEHIGGTDNIWEELDDGTTVALDDDMRLHRTDAPIDWVMPVIPDRFKNAAAG